MLKVALTGNIASGKSTVARSWREEGARVIESDALARQAVARGTPALERIAGRWGPGILLPTGELDRAALRDVVFCDDVERRHLEGIVHPEVNRLRTEAFARAEEEGVRVVAADIPLLFEVGLEKEFDVVVLVDAPEDVRLHRLVENRGIGSEMARRMIAAQWPSSRKRVVSDFVIENSGTVAELKERAREIWAALVEQAFSGEGAT